MSEFHDFFERAHALRTAARPFATAVVVRAEKPTSAKPGDRAIVTLDGTLEGWVGGACAQQTVIRESLAALADNQPRLIRLSVEAAPDAAAQGRIDLPMTCFSGGLLEIHIQPNLPPARLLIIGHSPIGRALEALGAAMGYDVRTVSAGPVAGDLHTSTDELGALADAMTPETYVLVSTSGHHDEAALAAVLRLSALRTIGGTAPLPAGESAPLPAGGTAPLPAGESAPRYIGVVASRKRFGAVREYLLAEGFDEAALARVKAPAGLDIGARLPEEIALSILAEIVERRRTSQDKIDWGVGEAQAAAVQAHVAIDPVCGMEVDVACAQHIHEHAGQSYYFCCGGCRKRFAADPGAYLKAAPPTGEALDPICGMTVDVAKARFMSEHDGKLFYFCCGGCKTRFDQEPGKYLAK